MRRVVGSSILAIVLAFSAATISADSPVPTGFAAGIELCPEFICGFALFAGQFEGQVNSKPANGGFVAAVTHDDLPEFLQVAEITGGQFIITAGRRTFRGDVLSGGEIVTLNPERTQFCVAMTLDITDGGNGQVYFRGLLDHGPFPPTIAGFVTQSPSSCLD